MKKFFALALALCFITTALPVSAETHDGKKHKMSTKSHKMHTKSTKKGAHIKATPKMPKTGMGGASN